MKLTHFEETSLLYEQGKEKRRDLETEIDQLKKRNGELEMLLEEAQQWIDSEPEWKDKYMSNYSKLLEQLGSQQLEIDNLKINLKAYADTIHEKAAELALMKESDRMFRMVIDKLTADNHGLVPNWLLDMAPNSRKWKEGIEAELDKLRVDYHKQVQELIKVNGENIYLKGMIHDMELNMPLNAKER